MSKERAREVWRLSLPIIGGMTSQNLLNLVDAWMVGGLGPAALAGTGLANFLNFIAVAFITGWGLQEEDQERCRALGVQTVLFKPVSPAQLHRAVQSTLAEHATRA